MAVTFLCGECPHCPDLAIRLVELKEGSPPRLTGHCFILQRPTYLCRLLGVDSGMGGGGGVGEDPYDVNGREKSIKQFRFCSYCALAAI